MWHERQKLAAEVEELRRKLAEASAKTGGKGKKNKSERRGRNGHKPPPAAKTSEPQEGHGPTAQPHLPTEDKPCDLDEPDKVCTTCGGTLEEWVGQEEEAELIDVQERQFVLQRLKKKKFRCRCGACIETAPGPDKVIMGGRYSLAFAVEVAHDKYLLHNPLERQAREMTRQHVGEVDDLGAKNLANFFAPGLMASRHGCTHQTLC